MGFLSTSHFWIVTGYDICWRCRTTTSVYCLAVPAGARTNPHNDEFNTRWPSTLAYVKDLSSAADSSLSVLAPCYRYDDSKTAGVRYRMNHCESCDARLGDHHLHHAGAVFSPLYDDDISVRFLRVPCPLVCRASRYVGVLAKSLRRVG